MIIAGIITVIVLVLWTLYEILFNGPKEGEFINNIQQKENEKDSN